MFQVKMARLVAVVSLAPLAALLLPAQSKAQAPTVAHPRYPSEDPQERLARWRWTNEAWTANEAVYAQAHLELKNIAKQRPFTRSDLLSYEHTAKTSTSSVAMYKWALAAYAWATTQDSAVGGYYLQKVSAAFAMRPSPHSYEYARARFLVEAYQQWTQPEIEGIANRLLKRKPNDLGVEFWAIKNARIVSYNDAAKTARLRQRTLSFVKRYPENIAAVSLAAEVHNALYWRDQDNNLPDLQRALNYYKRAQQLAPPARRKDYDLDIQLATKELARAQKRRSFR